MSVKSAFEQALKTHSLKEETFGVMLMKLGYGNRFSTGQASMYKTYTKINKKYKKYIGQTKFEIKKVNESEKIWFCWFQGLENAPALVKNCYESLKYHNTDKEIVVLDNNNLSNYLTLPDYIIKKWKDGIISNAHFSDIVRVELLIEHGGYWVDATTYFTGKMPEFINKTGLFFYQAGWLNNEMINFGSWFMFAKPYNQILLEVRNLLFVYWQKENYLKQYFLLHIFFRMVYDYYPNELKKMPYYNQIDNHILANEITQKFNQERFNQIKETTSIHKLSNKLDLSQKENNSFYDNLNNLYKM